MPVIFTVVILAGCTAEPPKADAGKVVRKPSASAPAQRAALPSPPPPPPPKPLSGKELIATLLPSSLADKEGWASDLFAVLEALKIETNKDHVCAVLAEIGQESSFQVDPEVPGLSGMVRTGLAAKRDKYRIPQWLFDAALNAKSPDGRTYNARIDGLKTEGDLAGLYEDMLSDLSMAKRLLEDYNPVQTIGPMQVSLAFSKEYAATHPYPFPNFGSVREALMTRRGGLYYGVAYLLDYPANYDKPGYRFADYNGGRYSSRNAAFQNAVSYLSGMPLTPDGDLLIYRNGLPTEQESQTLRALARLAPKLRMNKGDIARSLQLEKSPQFERTLLYVRVYELAPTMPRAAMPEIVVGGPKTGGKLTTAVYAKKVEGRYRRCMTK